MRRGVDPERELAEMMTVWSVGTVIQVTCQPAYGAEASRFGL